MSQTYILLLSVYCHDGFQDLEKIKWTFKIFTLTFIIWLWDLPETQKRKFLRTIFQKYNHTRLCILNKCIWEELIFNGFVGIYNNLQIQCTHITSSSHPVIYYYVIILIYAHRSLYIYIYAQKHTYKFIYKLILCVFTVYMG